MATIFDYLAKQAGLQKRLIVQTILVIMILMVIFGIFEGFITNLFGVSYPLLMSLYALENEKVDEDR